MGLGAGGGDVQPPNLGQKLPHVQVTITQHTVELQVLLLVT